MRIISFTWTSCALRARRKTVTRRGWTDEYAEKFEEGELVAAYDKLPRSFGTQIGIIRLTRKPFKESKAQMCDADYEDEGFAFLDEYPLFKPRQWRDVNLRSMFETERLEALEATLFWVVHFEILEIVKPLLVPPRQFKKMHLLFTDQAEYYAVCPDCYSAFSHMQWSGSTNNPGWREKSQCYLEKHIREDGRCEFCDPEIGNGGWKRY